MQRQPSMLRSFGEISPKERYILYTYSVIYPIMNMYPVSYVYPVHIYHTPINVSNLCQATFKYLNIKSICTKYHYVTGDQVKFGIFLSFRERFDAAPLSGRPSPHD